MQDINDSINLPKVINRKVFFGSRIRAARQAKGYSQKELASKIGRKPNTVACIERGEQAPEWATMEAIFEILGEPPEYYFNPEAKPTVVDSKPTPAQALAVLAEMVQEFDKPQLPAPAPVSALPATPSWLNPKASAWLLGVEDTDVRDLINAYILGLANGRRIVAASLHKKEKMPEE